jgi:hypothetical protein
MKNRIGYQYDTAPENIVSMFETALKYGGY